MGTVLGQGMPKKMAANIVITKGLSGQALIKNCGKENKVSFSLKENYEQIRIILKKNK